MPISKSEFKPAWWLRSAHLQTLWSTFFRPRSKIQLAKTEITLPDGDFIDLMHSPDAENQHDKPIILVMHGLEGSMSSHYITPLLASLQSAEYNFYFMHFRGCSGKPNRLARSYHSGDTGDIQFITDYLQDKHQQAIFCTVGYSLGGNVLLKWLGEQGNQANTQYGIAISVPFLLDDAARRMNQGFSKVYQNHLVTRLQKKYQNKFSQIASPLAIDIEKLKTFYLFDDQVTAPLHGFDGVDDYYQHSSSRQFIKQISKPTLILHSKDDPFMYAHTAPTEEELSEQVTLELSDNGGHVGFVYGKHPLKPEYWIEKRILQWLNEQPN